MAQTPTVSRVIPGSGPTGGGTVVTICGTGFVATPTVKFNLTLATGVTFISSTELRATTPAGLAGQAQVVVTNPGNQTVTVVGAFLYLVAAPSVLSVNPTSGPMSGGTPVTIYGANFPSNVSVRFGSSFSTINSVTPTQITATTLPHAPGLVDVVVKNESDFQSGKLQNAFTFSAGKLYTLVPACRIVDTRNPNAPLAALSNRDFTVTGSCTIPPTARAVAANVAVTQGTQQGGLSIRINEFDVVYASTINYNAGQTLANAVAVMPLSVVGKIWVYSFQASGTVHFILDITGYYQ